jgi:hypothetical protein
MGFIYWLSTPWPGMLSGLTASDSGKPITITARRIGEQGMQVYIVHDSIEYNMLACPFMSDLGSVRCQHW